MTTLEHHPIWQELARSSADEVRGGMARALFARDAEEWEAAAAGTPPLDPLTTLAVAYAAAGRFVAAAVLFGDARGTWEPVSRA